MTQISRFHIPKPDGVKYATGELIAVRAKCQCAHHPCEMKEPLVALCHRILTFSDSRYLPY